VVIHEFGFPRLALPPFEANSPSIVDANAVLSGSIAFQSLKTITGRHAQILKSHCRVKNLKFGFRAPLNLLGDAFHGVTRE
jgi:hypothetical protein